MHASVLSDFLLLSGVNVPYNTVYNAKLNTHGTYLLLYIFKLDAYHCPTFQFEQTKLSLWEYYASFSEDIN